MKRCRALFLALAALALCLAAERLTAAEYPAAPSAVPPDNTLPPPFRIVPATPPVPAANTNEAAPRPGEIELRVQFKLLSALAQEHRQRAEAATKSDQAQRARWETELAEELSGRGSNTLSQLEEIASHKQALVSGSASEAAGPLSPAELDYLAKVEERLRTVQQEIAAASEETTAIALQAATNRDTVVYGDYTVPFRLQGLGMDLKRLRTEQADLELKTSQFWALRAMLYKAQNVPPSETNQRAASTPAPATRE